MLNQIIEEWAQAQAKQVVTESVKPPEGKVTYQKSIIDFRGAKLELTLAAVDDSIGIDVDRPDSFTRKLTALNTNRNVEIHPHLENMTATDIYSAILAAITPEARKYEQAAMARNKNHKQSLFRDKLSAWRNTLNAVGYSKEDIDDVITYCTNALKKSRVHKNCDTFINVLAKYKNEILSKNPCSDFKNKTEQDIFYDEVALYIAKKITITPEVGTPFESFPVAYITDHLLKTDYDEKLSPYILKIKNILRDIHVMTEGKNPNFCFVITALGAYFERTTKESPAFRYAAILERKENERRKRFFGNKKPFNKRPESARQKTDGAERPNKPYKKFKNNNTQPDPDEIISINPIGENMFEHALENARPLK